MTSDISYLKGQLHYTVPSTHERRKTLAMQAIVIFPSTAAGERCSLSQSGTPLLNTLDPSNTYRSRTGAVGQGPDRPGGVGKGCVLGQAGPPGVDAGPPTISPSTKIAPHW